MPPKNASKTKSGSKKRTRVVADVDDVSETDEILPAKTTKRTYAFYNPIEPKTIEPAVSEKVGGKSQPPQRNSHLTGDKSDESESEPLKRRPRPRPKPKHAESKDSKATPTSSSTALPAKESSVRTKGVGTSNKSGEIGLSISNSYNGSSNHGSSNNGQKTQKNGKKQPLTSVQQLQRDFENQENRDQATPVPEEHIPKKNKSQRAPNSMSLEQLQAAYDDLKEQYNHLQSLRTTEAERHMEEYRVKLQAANRTLEQYKSKVEPQLEVRSLQHQLRDYEAKEKQRAKEDRARERTLSMEKLLASPDVNRQSASLVKTMAMYQNLTGLKVTPCNEHLWGTPSPSYPNETHPETWECEHTGPLGTLRFSLSYDTKTDLVTYTPSIDPDKDARLIQSLPEYMTVEIEFERQFESKLFWRILNYNHDQDDDS
ncbi:hypothetical protein BGW41_002559 [Actinomortierella wolfii]|nr:hypothetical protein BGW41_002559 [Actinomortierella wolfii]